MGRDTEGSGKRVKLVRAQCVALGDRQGCTGCEVYTRDPRREINTRRVNWMSTQVSLLHTLLSGSLGSPLKPCAVDITMM